MKDAIRAPSIIPYPQPDQTLASLLALTWVRNGMNVTQFLHAANVSWTFKYDVSFPHKVKFCYDWLGNVGLASPQKLIANHCYIPAIRPFFDPTRYEMLMLYVLGTHPIRNRHAFPTQIIRRPEQTLHFCAACVEYELSLLGYAYAHRTHQVIGVELCPTHRIPLGCVAPVKHEPVAKYGVLFDRPLRITPSQTTFGDVAAKRPEAWLRFAEWVESSLGCTLPTTTFEQRRGVIQHHLGITESDKSDGLPDLLREAIVSQFGEEALELVQFKQGNEDREWAGEFINGVGFQDHAIANLLVLSALVPGPAELATSLTQ